MQLAKIESPQGRRRFLRQQIVRVRSVQEERRRLHVVVGVKVAPREAFRQIIRVIAKRRVVRALETRLGREEGIAVCRGRVVVKVGILREIGILVEVVTFSRLRVTLAGKRNSLRRMRRQGFICVLCEGAGEARRRLVRNGSGNGSRGGRVSQGL